MTTLRDILLWSPNDKERDQTSSQTIKLTLITIWANQHKPLRYVDIARIVGCGERTAYRAVMWLREKGLIDQLRKNKNEGTIWMFCEGTWGSRR